MSEMPRSIHFVAIGGTGMGSLAGLLHARGLRVTGSDDHLYPPMSTLLQGWGIPVNDGFRAEHALAADPDLVVIGNAVRPDNPEARAVIDEGIPYRSFSDALYELAFREKVFAAMAELQWFITEQVEEEKTVREIVAKFHMVKDDSAALLDLDRELGGRAPEKQESGDA